MYVIPRRRDENVLQLLIRNLGLIDIALSHVDLVIHRDVFVILGIIRLALAALGDQPLLQHILIALDSEEFFWPQLQFFLCHSLASSKS
jgi:hypothetical protein